MQQVDLRLLLRPWSSGGKLLESILVEEWNLIYSRSVRFTSGHAFLPTAQWKAQIFLEPVEGRHLFLSPSLRYVNRHFLGHSTHPPPLILRILWFRRRSFKDGCPSSAVVGVPSGLVSLVSFHSLHQHCSFSSGSQPELLFLAGLTSFVGSFGSYSLAFSLQPLLRRSPSTVVLQTILPFPVELKGSFFRFFIKYFLFSIFRHFSKCRTY